MQDLNNLVYATLDWETINQESQYAMFHDIFMQFYDIDTCELVDPDGIHPFSLASKLNSEDVCSFQEIMNMSSEEINNSKWLDSMDKVKRHF